MLGAQVEDLRDVERRLSGLALGWTQPHWSRFIFSLGALRFGGCLWHALVQDDAAVQPQSGKDQG